MNVGNNEIVTAELASDSSKPEIEEAAAVLTSTPRSHRLAARKLQASVGRYVSVLCGGLVVMWSVFNLSWNVMAFRADTNESSTWMIALIMVFVTCILPLLAGFWLLFGSLSNK